MSPILVHRLGQKVEGIVHPVKTQFKANKKQYQGNANELISEMLALICFDTAFRKADFGIRIAILST